MLDVDSETSISATGAITVIVQLQDIPVIRSCGAGLVLDAVAACLSFLPELRNDDSRGSNWPNPLYMMFHCSIQQ